MAFCKNTFQQMSLMDSLYALTEREKKLLKNSWAEFFATEVFPYINEERFSVLYSDNPASRPNNPVNVYMGLLLLKEMNDQSDEEVINSLIFDIRYQYALHTTSMEEQPVSKNSLSNFRTAVLEYCEANNIDLIQEEIEALAPKLKKLSGIDGQTKRMDSMMVASSCRKLSRLELFYSVISRLIRAIDKVQSDKLPDSLKRYLGEGHRNEIIYRSRSTDVETKYAVLLSDALLLRDTFANTELEKLEDYMLLNRFLGEQTIVKEGTTNLIDAKELSPASLQNPTDTDATYRKKGQQSYQGYVANLVEAVGNNTGIIESYDFRVNTYSDAQFAEDTIKKLGQQELETNLIVDGAFYTTNNAKKAKGNNINLLPTNLTGRKSNLDQSMVSQFDIDIETYQVKSCPQGHRPITSNHKKEIIRAHFNKKTCMKCPNIEHCPVSKQKKSYLLQISTIQFHRSQLITMMGTKEYQDKVKIRAGVEGLPSSLRRKYGVDEMPIRGLLRSKIWFGLKVGALNIRRAIKWLKNTAKSPCPVKTIFHLLEILVDKRMCLSFNVA